MTTHWISESGIIDLFVFVGPTAKNVFSQYASLTGLAPLPPVRLSELFRVIQVARRFK